MRPLFHASPDERRARRRAPIVAGVAVIAVAAVAAAFANPDVRNRAVERTLATTDAAHGRLMRLLDVQSVEPPRPDAQAQPAPDPRAHPSPDRSGPLGAGKPDAAKSATVSVIVASPELKHPLFANSVIYVAPLPSGGHLGIILNRPTRAKLGEIFPDHEPSQHVAEPVFFGGPVQSQIIVAIIQSADRPSDKALPIAQRTYIAFDAPTIDHAIEKNSEHSRFYAGFVVWGANQLEQQIADGAWTMKQVDAKEILRRQPEALWPELSGPSKGTTQIVFREHAGAQARPLRVEWRPPQR